MASLEQARAAKRALRESLAGADGVTGVGLAPTAHAADATKASTENSPDDRGSATDDEDDWCVLVNVATAEASGHVPSDVGGVPVRVRVSGTITAN
ncbi:hypothetical protein [Georgenia halophila]|uniref:hypothetical protein n=1 Tax=Georgenia halophila TaxID=620889 RepID=UPI0031EE1240